VNRTPPPPGFENSPAPTAEQLKAQNWISQDDLERLQRCIDKRHIAAIDYTDAKGLRSKILIRPVYIRMNSVGNMVVWGVPLDADHWEELRFDRINGVQDTGEVFEPTW
jgi:hypothetical protein